MTLAGGVDGVARDWSLMPPPGPRSELTGS